MTVKSSYYQGVSKYSISMVYTRVSVFAQRNDLFIRRCESETSEITNPTSFGPDSHC